MVFDTTALKSTKAMVACAAGYEVYTAAVQVAGGVGERQRCDSNQLLHHLQHSQKKLAHKTKTKKSRSSSSLDLKKATTRLDEESLNKPVSESPFL